MSYLTQEQNEWCDAQQSCLYDLLCAIAKIPAPSHHEEQRAQLIFDQLRSFGVETVMIDEAKNVILKIGDCENGPVSIVMAHTDIAFPDTEEIKLREQYGKLIAPGVGDDTANLANLLIAAQYLIGHGIKPKKGGLLIVANSCEEGLGNLEGSKRIIQKYGNRAERMISFDLYMGNVVARTVGSHRYRININAEGGHSYHNFGNRSAVAQMAELITALYAQIVPDSVKTTYNVGMIRGGTSVNSIPEHCEALYEYRSEDRACMETMRLSFEKILSETRAKGIDVSAERIGDRPCMGDVDPERQAQLADSLAALMLECTGKSPKRDEAMSTDCNSALAEGIPAVCIGTVSGALMHTREEWIDPASLKEGLRIALGTLLLCCGITNE